MSNSASALSFVDCSCWLYFVRGGGLIKIGITTRTPMIRFRGLQGQSPVALELAAVRPGHPPDERELHQRFEAHRAHCEWFRSCPEIEEEISASRTRYGNPDPELGVPEHLLSFAASEEADTREEALLASRRAADYRRAYVLARPYLNKGQQLPADIEALLYKTGSLVSQRSKHVQQGVAELLRSENAA